MASSNKPPSLPTRRSWFARTSYRLWQLWRALSGRITPDEDAQVRAVLTPAEYVLYAQMPGYDRRHTLDVALLLRIEGCTDPDLLAMTLLHDIGKVGDDGRPLGLGWYGIGVVLRRWPRVLRVAQWGSASLRRLAVHETRSVQAAQNGGARPTVVALLRALAAGDESPALRLFHEADDRC